MNGFRKAVKSGFLRVRGGVSKSVDRREPKDKFSPRTRRCFHLTVPLATTLHVFSAYAEVFLTFYEPTCGAGGFLRVRGGVSMCSTAPRPRPRFSPRTRRCFCTIFCIYSLCKVFSAYAEVFLEKTTWNEFHKSFLRVRGGVSNFGYKYYEEV